MWTAKRILILFIALLVCLGSFAIYSLAFGIIDGLRPLPTEYLPVDGPDLPPPPTGPIVDELLQMAFGSSCKELQHRFRLWLPDKGIAFAAGDFTIDKEKDGRVRLAPFSAAIFHKAKAPNGYPEISTIQSDVAIVTLDRPVSNYAELNNRKIVEVEMIGKRGVNITNNRRTQEKNDDVDILISNGPLIYEERYDKIRSDGVVCVTDHQSKPPTVIRGSGLEMRLLKQNGPRTVDPARGDTGNIQSIKLLADVQMHFWVDAKAGFLGGTPNAKKPAEPPVADAKPAPKAQIHIRTGGPFLYNLVNEHAWFESPPPRDGGKDAEHIAPDQVHVERSQTVHGKETLDQLICDRLELQFRKKTALDAANPPAAGGDKEIKAARALKRGSNDVTLALDSEKLAAYGSELLYKAGDHVNGPETVLKGEPNRLLRAIKDGHKLKCIELRLFGANRFGEGQRAWAKGPGEIDMVDARNPEKLAFPTHLLWQDTLSIVKDREGGQVFDLMTVVGNASFIDDVQKQELHGDKIMVWWQTKEGEQKVDAVGGGKLELHRVIAQDAVRAISPEYIIRQTARLTMTFNKKFGRDDHLPMLPDIQVVKVKREGDPEVAPKIVEPQPREPGPKPLVELKPAADPKKPAPPVELTANEVNIVISTIPDNQQEKKQLDELIAKGNVYVFQAGEVPGEKRIDIVGQLLTLRAGDLGHTLVVFGDRDKLAKMEIGETILHGPVITINQTTNRADIEGNGAMEMPSNKNLDGTQSAKKNMRVIVQWNKNMTFDGTTARFNGGVQAWEQGAYSQIKCEVLSAILDKHVSFKDGQKAKENAKIDRFVCDKNVYVDDAKLNDKKQLEQRTFLSGLYMINLQDGPTNLRGPGEVRHLAPGGSDMAFGPPQPGAAKQDANKKEWKLTHVKFRDAMTYKTVDNTKTATFYGMNSGVEVFHFPTQKINDAMNAAQPPKDGLFLRSDILVVEAKQEKERTAQTMIARGSVMFKTDKYLGYADVVKFDDTSDIVILESMNGNVVRLFEIVGGETRPRSINSTKVLYNRRTGDVRTEGVKSITN